MPIETTENTEIAYWESKADKAHRILDLLIKRYESATLENYKLLLRQIAKAEADIDRFEAMYDKTVTERVGA